MGELNDAESQLEAAQARTECIFCGSSAVKTMVKKVHVCDHCLNELMEELLDTREWKEESGKTMKVIKDQMENLKSRDHRL
jgi:ribosomal protein L37AE/L43A